MSGKPACSAIVPPSWSISTTVAGVLTGVLTMNSATSLIGVVLDDVTVGEPQLDASDVAAGAFDLAARPEMVVGVAAGEIDPWAGADWWVTSTAGIADDPAAGFGVLDREDVGEAHGPISVVREGALEGHEVHRSLIDAARFEGLDGRDVSLEAVAASKRAGLHAAGYGPCRLPPSTGRAR